MAANEQNKISPSEWEIMRVVWTEKETTSHAIGMVLNEKMNWKAATTKTLIGRLVKKGWLNTKLDGKKYIYSPAVSEEESIHEAAMDLMHNICDTKIGQTLIGIIEESPLSLADIDALEELLNKKRKTAPAEVRCSCIPGQCSCHHHEQPEHIKEVSS